MSILWSFKPVDSCFFREAKPFNASEGGFLNSQFPPPAQTLIGSFRNTIGETIGVNLDWKDYGKNPDNSLRKVIGAPDNLAPLSFSGPFILQDGRRLYPAPLHLLYKLDDNQYEWAHLQPGGTVTCDIDNVALPEVAGKFDGGKLPENVWLNETDFNIVLGGGLPTGGIKASELVSDENRAGIGRNNQRSTVEEGLLYFVRHLWLDDKVSFGINVNGLPDSVTLPEKILTRFGGEGRLAELSNNGAQLTFPVTPHPTGCEKGLILTLLTHGDFSGKPEPDWAAINTEYGENLSLKSACIGKPVREGGWDYAGNKPKPKPLKSLVPSGSSYFVEVTGDITQAIDALHGKKIGNRTEFGYGEIAVGLWK